MTEDAAHKHDNTNYSISAYRVLYILLLLVRHRMLSLADLNIKLLENPNINRAYNSETITKYINTLRQSGCKIPRANSQSGFQYRLLKNPFPIEFTDDEIQAANELLTLLSRLPDEDLHVNYANILKKVAWMVTDEGQVQQLFGNEPLAAGETLAENRELLSRYRELCKDAQVLEVDYRINENDQATLRLEPVRVLQEGERMYLTGMDPANLKKVKLELERIILVRQLPFKVQHKMKVVNVTFVLSGRLAKTYRLFPDETRLKYEDGRLTIRSKSEDYQALLNRLMKYGYNCEVLSPGYVRDEMQGRISQLLSVYGASTE